MELDILKDYLIKNYKSSLNRESNFLNEDDSNRENIGKNNADIDKN